MPLISVAEAAEELDLSPRRVRQMLADGVLDGERVGRAWVVERDHVRRLVTDRPEVGRPWNPASAWAVLALVDGEGDDLSPVARARARRRLALGLDHIAGRLGARCARRPFYAHPGVLDRLADEVVLSGISAAPHHGADVVAGEGVEGYLRAGDLGPVAERLGLDDQAARPNVLLRIVDDQVWPFGPGQRHAGRAVVGLDLLESEDPRTRRAGAELLDLS